MFGGAIAYYRLSVYCVSGIIGCEGVVCMNAEIFKEVIRMILFEPFPRGVVRFQKKKMNTPSAICRLTPKRRALFHYHLQVFQGVRREDVRRDCIHLFGVDPHDHLL